MKNVKVKVKVDHLESIARSKKPILAIAELIWNGLDADASEVKVNIIKNKLDRIEKIVVIDNGHGISYEEAEMAFESLGGSWKRQNYRSRIKHRMLHGKGGKGRFRPFAIGLIIEWNTRFKKDGKILKYNILGQRLNLGEFQIGDIESCLEETPGTEVTISEIQKNFPTLLSFEAVQELAQQFALYLREYPDVSIWYNNEILDPAKFEDHIQDYTLLDLELPSGKKLDAILTVIEWKNINQRSIYLCDEDGFAFEQVGPKIQAAGFNFTAYFKSNYIRELDEENNLVLDEIHPDLSQILEITRESLRCHFRQRASEKSVNLVREWKKDNVYPYEGEPKSIIEKTERQVFDVCALSINSYLPEFENTEWKNKRLALRLLKQAIESSPEALQKVLSEVLDLPEIKQKELACLLERTSLTAIINASKLVANRLDFIKGLEILLYDPESRATLLERKQLHRILANETWIFGEEFNLTVDDQSLNEVLRKHIEILGREEIAPAPVLREDGSKGIIDLMLSRVIPQAKAEKREHLVIELKRPSQCIDQVAIQQITDYAFAVSNDERFRDTDTNWIFWGISNDVNNTVKMLCRQRNRPEGIYLEEGTITIWVKSWGQIIESCRARLQFFQQKLEYTTDSDSALKYLHEIHSKYLPDSLA